MPNQSHTCRLAIRGHFLLNVDGDQNKVFWTLLLNRRRNDAKPAWLDEANNYAWFCMISGGAPRFMKYLNAKNFIAWHSSMWVSLWNCYIPFTASALWNHFWRASSAAMNLFLPIIMIWMFEINFLTRNVHIVYAENICPRTWRVTWRHRFWLHLPTHAITSACRRGMVLQIPLPINAKISLVKTDEQKLDQFVYWPAYPHEKIIYIPLTVGEYGTTSKVGPKRRKNVWLVRRRVCLKRSKSSYGLSDSKYIQTREKDFKELT